MLFQGLRQGRKNDSGTLERRVNSADTKASFAKTILPAGFENARAPVKTDGSPDNSGGET